NSTSSTVSITECDSYTWNGINYTNSGNYSYLTTNLVGCDSTAYLNLTINYNSSLHTMWAGACDSYTWNGNTYYSSGTYVWNGINSSGCDSIVQLYLTVENSSDTTFYASSCYNYVWRSTTYSSSGIYYDTLTNQNNCDSILTLVLTIYNSNNSYQTITECDSYAWNGSTYTSPGTYTYSTTNSNGCDSTATLNLILHSTTFSYETKIECISYMWNGNVYTNSGTYTFTSSNNNGCDSIATLYLTIDNGSEVFDTVTVCYGESYVVGNSIYSISGIYLDSVINSNGCLSTISTNFTVSDEIIPNINQNGSDLEVLVAGGNSPYSYLWNTSSTSSVITVVAIGTYWVIVTDASGCFSDTVYFEVTNLSTDILDSEINHLIIYPNPSSGIIHLQIDVINILDIEIRIINSTGQIIEKNNLSDYKGEYTHSFNLSEYSKGIYFLELETENGKINKKLILQ
ncbi:MAG: T9SS type A sorting domain-containing protein, partial [Flavobacteriales bacterium]|nr:T9SS type A sorting domain-containing protein [Flavobacteriales bacterium]